MQGLCLLRSIRRRPLLSDLVFFNEAVTAHRRQSLMRLSHPRRCSSLENGIDMGLAFREVYSLELLPLSVLDGARKASLVLVLVSILAERGGQSV
jgi:hypothetical protein